MSVDSDFVGGGRPGVGGYMQPWNIEIAEIYNRAGVLNGDRESAAIVTLSALFGRRGDRFVLWPITYAQEKNLKLVLDMILQ